MLSQVLDYIARTNLFNFIIFLSIIIFLVKKINVSEKLNEAKNSVDLSIEESKTVKEESEAKLNAIEQSMANIETEVEEILKKSEETAKLVGAKILEDAGKSAQMIQANMEKAVENSRILLKNDLIKRASLASIEAARANILNELNANQGLHDRLIDESIDAIEGGLL